MAFNFLKSRARHEISKSADAEWSLAPLVKTPKSSIGIVIGTYGSPAYIALQLEARRRFYPTLLMLIHDDFSSESLVLSLLCEKSKASFAGTSEKHGWSLGDMAAIVAGLD